MEYGGYISPPKALDKALKNKVPEGRPAELRTVPDCDYSMFRYSRISLPFLLLIIVSGAITIGLSFWQGPYGFIRGTNGHRDGQPRDFEINDGSYQEAGMRKSLKGLRAANFPVGISACLILLFVLCAKPSTGIMKAASFLCAFLLLSLGAMSSVSFALGIDQINWIRDCPNKLTFLRPDLVITAVAGNLAQAPYFSPADPVQCHPRIQISTAAVAADACQAMIAFILCFLLIYTTLDSNWAWGPGALADDVTENPNQPRSSIPPPSPFTHIAETRRVYVYVALFFAYCFIIIAFILMLKLHELRDRPKMVNLRNERVFTSGWLMINNRFRVSLSAFCIAAGVFSLVDKYIFKRRVISYLLGGFFGYVFVGYMIIYALDVKQVGDAGDLPCPTGSARVPLRCVQWNYFATCFMDFWTGFIILIYIIYEYLFRVMASYDTYYFYADSEWLRDHSIFVESTDREAFDWKKFTMDTGKEYYYSPTLGISTCARPKNYIEPEGYVEQFAYTAPPVAA